MTQQPAFTGSSSSPATTEGHSVDLVAERVRAVPGVIDLNGGAMGEVGTYLPGRRVAGIRLRDASAEVHVTVEYGRDVRRVAAAVQAAVQPLTGTSVNVTVADLQVPAELTTTDGPGATQQAGEGHAASGG